MVEMYFTKSTTKASEERSIQIDVLFLGDLNKVVQQSLLLSDV